jgi:soluble lytic murein transglycosylase
MPKNKQLYAVFHHRLKISLGVTLGLWLVTANGFDKSSQIAPINTINTAAPSTQTSTIFLDSEKLTEQRQLYKKAERAFKLHRYSQFKQLKKQLKDYPLYSYLEYKDLARKIGLLDKQQFGEFLEQNDDSIIANRLRRKLIKYYARHQRWSDLIAVYTPQQSTTLQCKYLQALINTGEKSQAFAHVEKLWLTSKSQPRSCDSVFKTWEQAGHRTDQLTWKRIQLAMAKNRTRLARYLAKTLPTPDRRLVNSWIKVHRKPQLLSKLSLLKKNHPMASAIRTHAIKRMSRKDPQQATVLWQKMQAIYSFSEAETNTVYKAIGLSMARSHHPDANIWLSQLDNEHSSKYIREWGIRSAIRQSDWQQTASAIEKLPLQEQSSLRWQFWWAYANEQIGNTIDANGIYHYLAGRRSYYGFLAADRLELPYVFEDHPVKLEEKELASIKQYPEVQRASELLKLNNILDARREWFKLTSSISNRQKLAASKLAQQWNWHDRAIYTMGKTDYRDDITLRFPLPMKTKVESWSEKQSIEPAWTYAIIRRESAFMKDARSSVGAMGLMQLMPRTARQVARSMRTRYRGRNSLLATDTNLKLGTRYLGQMLKHLDSQHVLATAAYNAGPHRVKSWLPDTQPMEAIRWIETIPFSETREYVSNVLAYTIIYQHRMNDSYTRLSQRMPLVPAKNRPAQTAQIEKGIDKDKS